MATVEEILSDPAAALGLEAGSVPTRIIIVAEYFEPGSDNQPDRPRLTFTADDSCAPWSTMGMLRYAEQVEYNAIIDVDDEDAT